jgi:hypothetical protein
MGRKVLLVLVNKQTLVQTRTVQPLHLEPADTVWLCYSQGNLQSLQTPDSALMAPWNATAALLSTRCQPTCICPAFAATMS